MSAMGNVRCILCDKYLVGTMFKCDCVNQQNQGFPRLVFSPQSNFSGNYNYPQWPEIVQGPNFGSPNLWQSPDNIQLRNYYNQTPQTFTSQQNQMGSNVPTNIGNSMQSPYSYNPGSNNVTQQAQNVGQGFDPYRLQHPQTARTFPPVCGNSMQSPYSYNPGSSNVAQQAQNVGQGFDPYRLQHPQTARTFPGPAQQGANVQNQYQLQSTQAFGNSVIQDQRLNTQTRNSNLPPQSIVQAPKLNHPVVEQNVQFANSNNQLQSGPAPQLLPPSNQNQMVASERGPIQITTVQEGDKMRKIARAPASNSASNSSGQPKGNVKASSTAKNIKPSELLGSDKKDEQTKTTTLLDCPICLESAISNNPSTTKCGHVFCGECIKNALKIKKKCPVCQKRITQKDVFAMFI